MAIWLKRKRQLSDKKQKYNAASLDISNSKLPLKNPWIFE